MRSGNVINKGAMSEAQLKKIQKDVRHSYTNETNLNCLITLFCNFILFVLSLQCSKMEDELNVYRSTVNLVEASNRYIKASTEQNIGIYFSYRTSVFDLL